MVDDAARDAEFAELCRRFLTEVVHRAGVVGARRTPIGDRVSEHLGEDARALAVVEETFPPHRIADIDAGFDALGVTSAVIGVSGGQQKRFSSLPELILSEIVAFDEAPVDYITADVGPG